jgi:hypothetical protein
MIMLCQWDFSEQIELVVTLYKRELFKKIPCLGTLCTLPGNEGLNNCCGILDKPQYSLLEKVNMTSSSVGSSQPKKVILLQWNMKPNNKHEFVTEAAWCVLLHCLM